MGVVGYTTNFFRQTQTHSDRDGGQTRVGMRTRPDGILRSGYEEERKKDVKLLQTLGVCWCVCVGVCVLVRVCRCVSVCQGSPTGGGESSVLLHPLPVTQATFAPVLFQGREYINNLT